MKKLPNRRRHHPGRRAVQLVLFLAFAAFAVWYIREDPSAPDDGGAPATRAEVPPASFTHEVRPLLADRCFSCHATAEATPPRLDTPAVGNVFLSHQSPEGGLGLPADDAHGSLLTLREKALLMRWCDEGAQHELHWAFQPLPPDLSPPADFLSDPWVSNGIDAFHRQQLAGKLEKPAPSADPLTLLRRVTIDLTGLPPTVAEAELLQSSPDPDLHYAQVVEDFLHRPAFGETFADLWLDAMQYADPRPGPDGSSPPLWQWRNWVLRSFHANRPVDEFLRLQLAGDLSPSPGPDDTLATAIFRAPLRQHAGPLPRAEQGRNNVDDRLHRLGRAYLGLPLLSHPGGPPALDPVTPADLDGLRLLLSLPGETGAHPPGVAPGAPTLVLPHTDDLPTLAKVDGAISRLEASLRLLRQNQENEFQAWLETPDKIPVIPDLAGFFDCDSPAKAFSNQALGNPTLGSAPQALSSAGVHRKAFVLGAGNQASFPEVCPATPTTTWSLSFWIRLLDLDGPPTVIMSSPGAEQKPGTFFLHHEAGVLTAGWERDGPTQAIVVSTPFPFEVAREWCHLALTCDGSGRAAGLRLFVNGAPALLHPESDSLPLPVFDGREAATLTFGTTEQSGSFLLDELHVHRRALSPLEIRHLLDQKGLFSAFAAPGEHREELRDYYLSAISPTARALRRALEQRWQEHSLLRARQPELPILRGSTAPDGRPAEKLFQDLFPEALCPAPSDRLALARWFTRPDHPLTARVYVNRVWEHFFGQGLAPSGFGLGAAAVSHPALLDWLARDFVTHGWDHRRLCRQIVLSQTYRQVRATPGPLPRRTRHDVLLALCGLLTNPSPTIPGAPGEPWRHLYLTRPPALTHDWRPVPRHETPIVSEELLTRSGRRISHDLLVKIPEGDEARMRELFLRFRCQDETHPEFKILLGLLKMERESFRDQGEGVPQLILGAGIEPDPGIDPVEWAAWLEVCTALVSDENLLKQR